MYTLRKDTDISVATMPGIPGYGQKGADGITGASGSSVYFSALSDKTAIAARIGGNLSLTDNDELLESVYYSAGDIILDIYGNMYVWNGSTLEEYDKSIFGSTTALSISARCVTGLYENTPALISNPEYIRDYNSRTSSKWLCHRDRYIPEIAGNWFLIDVDGDNLSDYNFVFSIRFPNGNMISSTDYSAEDGCCYMFVDNRFLYDTHPLWDKTVTVTSPSVATANVTASADPLVVEIEPLSPTFQTQSQSIPKIQLDGNTGVWSYIDYKSIDSNNEMTEKASTLCYSIMKDCCTAVVKAESKTTGKIYQYETNIE